MTRLSIERGLVEMIKHGYIQIEGEGYYVNLGCAILVQISCELGQSSGIFRAQSIDMAFESKYYRQFRRFEVPINSRANE